MNDPANWRQPFTTTAVHIVLTLSSQSEEIQRNVTEEINVAAAGAHRAHLATSAVFLNLG